MKQKSSVELKEVIKTLTAIRRSMLKYEQEIEQDEVEENVLKDFTKYISKKIKQTRSSELVKQKMSNLIDAVLTNKK